MSTLELNSDQNGVSVQRGPRAVRYLQSGNDSQAHYAVPLGDKTLSVVLARPRSLKEKDHDAFDQVLQDMTKRLRTVVSAFGSAYADQAHVQGDIRVYQPGDYLKLPPSEEGGTHVLQPGSESYVLHLTYGGLSHSLRFESPNVDMQTTRRALNRLLQTLPNPS